MFFQLGILWCNWLISFLNRRDGLVGGYHEGLVHARRAVELHPEFAAAWDTLGVALARTGSDDEARVAFETALRINPELDATRTHLSEELAPL